MPINDDWKELLEGSIQEQNESVEILERVAREFKDLANNLKSPAFKNQIDRIGTQFYFKPSAAYDIYKVSKEIWEIIELICDDTVYKEVEMLVEDLDKIIFDGFPADYFEQNIYYIYQRLWKCELELLNMAHYIETGGKVWES